LFASSGDNHAISRIPLSRIHSPADRPRRHIPEESVLRLADSIRLHGQLSPLLVRALDDGQYRLIAGERRLRALASLNRGWADAIVLSASPCDCALIALVENLQREQLHFLDVALACRRILEQHPITQERLAAGLSCSPSALANRLRLLKLSPAVQAVVRSEGLSERHARALLRLEAEADQLALARLAAREQLSVAQLERRVNERLGGHAGLRPKPVPALRDSRIVVNAVLDTVRSLSRIGVPVHSQVEQAGDCVKIIVTIPAAGQDSAPAATGK